MAQIEHRFAQLSLACQEVGEAVIAAFLQALLVAGTQPLNRIADDNQDAVRQFRVAQHAGGHRLQRFDLVLLSRIVQRAPGEAFRGDHVGLTRCGRQGPQVAPIIAFRF
jgi:hypothetical protein